jgi:RIO kinase 1
VEHDHPHALEFLRKDVLNVLEFFRKKLTEQIMTVRELFDFVVSDFDMIKENLKAIDPMNSNIVDAEAGRPVIEQDLLDAYLDKVYIQSIFENCI